jgi:chemotaxis protein MotB
MKRIILAGSMLALFAACGVKEEIYKRDVSALKDQIAQVESAKAGVITERNRLSEELSILGKEKGMLSTDLKKALDRVEELKLMAEKRKLKLRELKDKLQAMQAAGKLQVLTVKGRMVVKLPENVLFDTGKFKLKPEGEMAVAQLTPILASLEGRQFQVAGHTDDVGSDDSNWKLSANRALSVVQYMISQGMPPERLAATGYGKFQPVAANDTDEGKAQNRRIDINLVPNIDELLGFDEE